MSSAFTHAGDLGDIIYSLPAIRALGGGDLLLFDFPGRTTHAMTADRAKLIIPLLLAQPYISKAEWIDGRPAEDSALNGFRDWGGGSRNLVEMHLAVYGLPACEQDKSWLRVDRLNRIASVVFSRTSRYRTDFSWRRAVRSVGSSGCFLGTPEEHEDFCSECGPIGFHPTLDLLEAARIIAASDLFIGGQSALSAIAHGLGGNMLLAVHSINCRMHRPNLINAWGNRLELPSPAELSEPLWRFIRGWRGAEEAA